nr:MAG: RNA-dependent RNA polymerase [Usmuvirus newyorkense]
MFHPFSFLEEGDWEYQGKAPVLPDQRLQSPLKPDVGRLAYASWFKLMPEDRIPKWIILTVNQMAKLHQSLFSNVIQGDWNTVAGIFYKAAITANITQQNRRLFDRVFNIAWATTDAFYSGIQKESWKEMPTFVWPLIHSLFEARQQARTLKETMMRTSRGRETTVYSANLLGATVLMSRQLCLIHLPAIGSVFTDYDAILCLNDVMDQRYLAALSLCLYSYIYKTIYTISEDDFISVLRWGDNHLLTQKNEAFRVIKMYESICMAEMLRKSHPVNVSETFWNQRVDDYLTSGGMKLSLDELLSVIVKHDIPMISELFGIFRIWGHPVVNEIEGCRKVQEIGKAIVNPDPTILNRIRAAFVREFCINYIRSEGRWPDLTVIDPNSRIGKLYARRQTNWIQSTDQTDLSDWENVILRKNFDFDYCKDYTQLVDDKSISTYKSHWDSVYDPQILGYQPEIPTESRRLVLEILRRPDINLEAILQRIMERDIPDEWLVIGLHSKERELKIEPRLFVMLVLEARMFFCLTEHNLATQILQYFPQQTMTSSEPDLITRLLRVTDKYGAHRDVIPVVINIDFEKWNLRWRQSTTDDIFRVIDNLFGTPGLYTFSHEFFRRSMFYLVSRYQPPDVTQGTRLSPPEQNTVWYNDESGKEGIRQKGWTLITIATLLYIEAETNIRSVVTGQGDNQVIIAYFPVPDGVSKESHLSDEITGLKVSIEKYMTVLINTFQKIGMPVKREESWTSLGLFAYGKDIIWNGAVMPMCIKRCTRIAPDVNDTFPTLGNNLSTIFSSGQAACAKGFDIYIPYLIAFMEGAFYTLSATHYHVLSNGPIYSRQLAKLLNHDDNFLQLVMTLPHALGGYPVMSPVDYMARGHSDPVTAGLISMRILAQYFPTISKLLSYLTSEPPFSKRIDFKYLILDPTAINWDLPTPPTTLMKDIVSSEFTSVCQNRQMNLLFNAASKSEEQSLIDTLIKIRPVAPRVLNEIYRNSPSGAREGMLATVSHVKTIRSMAQQSYRSSLFNSLARYEDTFMNHLFNWYSISTRYELFKGGCSRAIADRWRSLSWFNDISICLEGVTMPHPLEQFKLEAVSDLTRVVGNHIIYIIEPSVGSNRIIEMGQSCAFVGSLTRERKMSRLLNQASNDPPLKAALRLQTLSDYAVYPNGPLSRLLDTIMAARTNVPLKLLRCSADRIIAGSRTHRLEDVTAKRGGLMNVRPNFTSFVYHSTDMMGRYAMGYENFNINYLLTIACHMVQLQYYECKHTSARVIYTGSLDCTSCTCILNEPLLDLDEEVTLSMQSYDQCYLVYSFYDPRGLERALSAGAHIRQVMISTVPENTLIEYLSYMLALQVILRADRATIGNVYGSTTHSPRYQTVILGIGEISLVGFKRLVLSISHLSMLLFLIKYFNRIITVRNITVESILDVAREVLNTELYKELVQAYPMPEIQLEIRGLVPDFVAPASAAVGGSGAIGAIQAIIDKFMLDQIKNMETLPPLQCNTFPEWYIVAELNVMHRILKAALETQCMHDEYFGRACVALKTTGHLDHIDSGTELLCALTDHVMRSVQQTSGIESDPELLRLNSLMFDTTFEKIPMLHAEEGVEKWLTAGKNTKIGRSAETTVATEEPRPTSVPRPPVGLKPFIIQPIHKECTSVNAVKVLPVEQLQTVHEKTRHDHVWRLDGVSTASYKLLQIIKWFNVNPLMSVCLGEGEGSIAASLYKIFNAGLIFYNSKLSAHDFPPHRYIHYKPSELACIPSNVLYKYDVTLYGPNDLTTAECQSAILSMIPNGCWTLVTCDAEMARLGHVEAFNLLRGALIIALNLLSNEGTFIFKSYLGILISIAQQALCLTAAFSQVHVVCPHFSSFESTEIYFVCSSKRENYVSIVSNILLNGLYPQSNQDFNSMLKLMQDLKTQRTAVEFPLQFLAYNKCCRIVQYMRKHYNRPTWRHGLYILTGGRFFGTLRSIEPWLRRRVHDITSAFNVLLTSLFEQVHVGYDWERLAGVLARNRDSGIQMYIYMRQSLHTDLLLLACYLKASSVPLRVCIRFMEEELSKTREHKLENGITLCSFNIRLHEPAWRKRYARHFYRIIGEIFHFKE